MTDYTRSQLHRKSKKDLQALLTSLGVEIIEPKNPNKAELIGAIMEKQGRMATTGEEQSAQPAGATLVDVTKPYCYQIDRPVSPEATARETLVWAGMSTTPVDGMTTQATAEYHTAETRVAHAYLGPITIRMWNKRDNEHYRMDPPSGCYQLDMGDQYTTPEALKESIDRLHTVQGIAGPAVPITPEVKR